MGLKGFACLAAIVLPSFILAGPAEALPKLQILPVDLAGYVGDSLKLTVELPCGGSFYGLVTKSSAKGTLEVAAAVSQDTILCASLPRPTEVVVDYLATTGFRVITPMNVDMAQNRLLVARITELRIVPSTKTKRAKLSAVYEPRCGATVGTLIRRAGARRLEVAIVEKPQGMAMAACGAKAKTRTITAIDIKSRLKIAALRDQPVSLSRSFELRLGEVKEGSVRVDADGALTLTYQRACNEAPVGIVLGSPVRTGGRETVPVGVLLARYYNYPCPLERTSGDLIVDELVEPSLTLPAKFAVTLIKPTDSDLALDTPHKLTRQLGQLSLMHQSTCGESFAVYGRDGRGGLAVGVLTLATAAADQGARSCKSAPGEVSLTQPYIASSVTPSGLAAMRLKGSLAH